MSGGRLHARWPRAARIVQVAAQAVPAILLLIAVAVFIAGSGLDVRLQIANTMVGAIVVVGALSLAAIVVFGIWGLLDRSAPWIGKAANIGMVGLGMSLLMVMVAPGVTAKLSLDRDMRVIFGADYLRISGAMGAELPTILTESMADDYRPNRIYLQNDGGVVAGGQDAAAILIDRGLDTAIIAGRCDSSCAFMALRFKNRYIAPGGELGFHDLYSYGQDNKRDRERAVLVDNLVAAGHSRETIEHLLSTRRIVRPTLATLIDEHIITGCWDESSKQAVDCAVH